jgi:preprotein translocase subunit SecE
VNRETKRSMQRQDGSTSAVDLDDPSLPSDGGAVALDRRPSRRRPATTPRRTSPAQFLREIRDELRQVAWPTRPELVNYTAVVLTTLVIMVGLIFLLNLAFGKFVVWIFER